jgi:hypothetical protein
VQPFESIQEYLLCKNKIKLKIIMVKEKLTPKIISKEIIENFDTLKLSWHGMTGIQFHIVTLLKQIQDEILQELNIQPETPMLAVLEIFNKYINEK